MTWRLLLVLFYNINNYICLNIPKWSSFRLWLVCLSILAWLFLLSIQTKQKCRRNNIIINGIVVHTAWLVWTFKKCCYICISYWPLRQTPNTIEIQQNTSCKMCIILILWQLGTTLSADRPQSSSKILAWTIPTNPNHFIKW